MFGPCFVMQFLVSFFSYAIITPEEERIDCFDSIVFILLSCCYCSVSLPIILTNFLLMVRQLQRLISVL